MMVPMSRVDLLDLSTAPISVRHLFSDGDPGPIVGALANVPELLAPALGFIGPALGAGALGLRAKEIAILRTSALQDCRYCISAHTGVALEVGLSVAEVSALRGAQAIEDAFPLDSERALIGWIDALAGGTGAIADEIWQLARASWSEHALVEVTVTVGATMFLNRFATAMQLPAPPDALGAADRAGGG